MNLNPDVAKSGAVEYECESEYNDGDKSGEERGRGDVEGVEEIYETVG